jgi:hypothetical protein
MAFLFINNFKIMKIHIYSRTVYGNQVIYPACQAAEAFAAIAGTKTLTLAALQQIKNLGFEIVENHTSALGGLK